MKSSSNNNSVSKSLSTSNLSTGLDKNTNRRRSSRATTSSLDEFNLQKNTNKNQQDGLTTAAPLVQVSLFSLMTTTKNQSQNLGQVSSIVSDETEGNILENESVLSFRNNEEISQQPPTMQEQSTPQCIGFFKELTRDKFLSTKFSAKKPVILKSNAQKDSSYSTINLMLEKIFKTIVKSPKKCTFLFLTRSNKDSRFIKDILSKEEPDHTKEIKVMSFHTFSSTLLKKAGKPFADATFKIISSEDTKFCLSKVLDHSNEKSNSLKDLSMDVEGIQNFIECLKLDMKSPDMLLREIISRHQRDSTNGERRRLMLLQNIYSEYENLKIQSKSLDFTDLLLHCHSLLSAPSNEILSTIGLSNRGDMHVFIDDFDVLDLPQLSIAKDLIYLMAQTIQTSLKSVTIGSQNLESENLANLKQIFIDPSFEFDIFNFESIEDQKKETIMTASHITIDSVNPFEDLRAGELVWKFISNDGIILEAKTLYTTISRFTIKGFEQNNISLPVETLPITTYTSELIFQSDSLSTPIGTSSFLTAPQKISTVYLQFSSKREQMEWLASIEKALMLQEQPLKMPPCFADKCQKLDVTKDQKSSFDPSIKINRDKIRELVYRKQLLSEQFLIKMEQTLDELEQYLNKSAKSTMQYITENGSDNSLKDVIMTRIFKELGKETEQGLMVDLKIEEKCFEWEKAWKSSLLNGNEEVGSAKLFSKQNTQPITQTIIEGNIKLENDETLDTLKHEETTVPLSTPKKSPNNVSSLDYLISNTEEKPMTIEQLASSVVDENAYQAPDQKPTKETPNKDSPKNKGNSIFDESPDNKDTNAANYSNYDAKSILSHFRKSLTEKKQQQYKQQKKELQQQEEALKKMESKKNLIEIDYEMNRLLDVTHEHLMLDDSAYAFDSKVSIDTSQINLSRSNQLLNISNSNNDFQKSPLFTPTKSSLSKLRELTSPTSPSTVFSSIVSKSLSKKLISPLPKSGSTPSTIINTKSSTNTPSRNEHFKSPNRASSSPSKAIHIIKMLKTGVSLYKHSSSGTSKKKLVHLFLSSDENYICYVKPEARNIVPIYEIKSKFPVSSIRYLQKGELVKKRRLLEIRGGLANALFGIKKEEMKIDALVLFSFCLPERYLDFEAKSSNEAQTWFEMWDYFVTTIIKNHTESSTSTRN